MFSSLKMPYSSKYSWKNHCSTKKGHESIARLA